MKSETRFMQENGFLYSNILQIKSPSSLFERPGFLFFYNALSLIHRPTSRARRR